MKNNNQSEMKTVIIPSKK